MVIIRYRRCRIGYGSASRITEAKTDGRKETTDGGGHGGDERAVGAEVAVGPLPSETKTERRWRTRPDPFDGVWEEEILPLLQGEAAGRLRATTIIEWLEEKSPGRFSACSAPCNADYRTGGHSTGRIRRSTSPRSIHLAGRRSSTSPTATLWE